jgi:hypothetical protein
MNLLLKPEHQNLEDYLHFSQAKVLGILWGLIDMEPNFISEQLKT